MYPNGTVEITNSSINVSINDNSTISARNYVWDTNTLDWIKAVSSGGSATDVFVTNFPSIQAVSQSGTWNITNISGTISLPTGASTSALQITGNTSLNSIDTKLPSSLTDNGNLKVALVESSSANIPYGFYNNSIPFAQTINSEGRLVVDVPQLPSHSVHSESFTGVFQTDAVYGTAQTSVVSTVTGSGSVSSTNSQFSCSSGTTVNSISTLQSRSRIRYRPGQGVVCRFSGYFSTPVADSYQLMGLGHPEDGVFVGYFGTQFGILYSKNGVREQRTLTINTASTTAESVAVVLDGVTFNVNVTNSNNIYRTAYEISLGTFSGWKAEAIGNTVLFISDSSGLKSGSYSLTASTASGSFVQTKAGVALTNTWIPQSSWNGDKLNGTGPSGVTIDPFQSNVFQISMHCLGTGNVVLGVELTESVSKKSYFITMHTIESSGTTNIFSNPSFPFTMTTISIGSTTNISVSCSSFSGFIVGERVLKGPVLSYINSASSVDSSAYTALFTIRNSRVFNGRANQSVINLLSMAGSVKHTQPTTIFLLSGVTLNGNPNFSQYSSNSSCQYDTSATTCNITSNNQIVFSFPLSETGNFSYEFEQTMAGVQIQPGSSITIAAKSVSGNPSYVVASLNTREEQ